MFSLSCFHCKIFEITHVFLFPNSISCSKFGDIFDEDFFIHVLRNNVNVVKELPVDILEQFDNNISSIVNLRVKAWSSPTYYLQKVLPKLVQMRFALSASLIYLIISNYQRNVERIFFQDALNKF